MHCPRSSSRCSSMQDIYARLEGDIDICALFYIYRLAISCAKFGVAVFKASMLDWRGQTLAIGICALFYIYRLAISCAKFGVGVFKASMFDWRGTLAIGMCIFICIYICH